MIVYCCVVMEYYSSDSVIIDIMVHINIKSIGLSENDGFILQFILVKLFCHN